MDKKFPEYKKFDLSEINKELLAVWEKEGTFEKSLKNREGEKDFVFYEGPPSANGQPGIHHVIARTIKDIFCRYKTLKGFRVNRKAGWDTHGLPVELGVEKTLNIKKEDIGSKISVEDFNKRCRSDVMKYTDMWEDITHKMGYWVNMDKPYITYENKYIETLWYLLRQLFDKGLLYKGHSIQPFSPAAGTGLSTHELNQPGCYRDVKDTTAVAQFKVIQNKKSEFLFEGTDSELFFLAWTTTPWTLLSNTALAVGKNITYVKIKTVNPYTGIPITVIMGKPLMGTLFSEKNKDVPFEGFKPGSKKVPFKVLAEYQGTELNEIRYEQLLPYQQPENGDAFRVIIGDFVTTEDGTGIVHIAPSFGADDYRVAQQNGIGSLTLVNRQGKFVEGTGEFSGRYVKNSYDDTIAADAPSVDVDIAVKLKQENRAFKIEKHTHSYPHCWRTDKPVIYYPLDSWFIKTTAFKDKMIELNNTINWKPSATGTGRFGKWLENLMDWNLSRTRYWGTPLPIWCTQDKEETKCIGSVSELYAEIEKSVEAGFMESNPMAGYVPNDYSKENYDKFDLHRPFIDNVILVSSNGKKMQRELDLIDVWFDSGAMPYAQIHYPFEHKDSFEHVFPADFIAEGVDQTRGWFFTLHALATMLFDSVAFKNIISNGLVQDAKGQKMSKRLGNYVDPFEVLDSNGADAVRWYMITNSQPWDNLKFDKSGVEEVKRKFFGTLYNTYSFFALYANVDGFNFNDEEVPVEKRPEIDRWIMSLLNSLIKNVGEAYETYEPTKAARLIQEFVTEHLSNWYVRLNRKRFWGGKLSKNKSAAYQTLFTCLLKIAKLASPIAPFYMDKLYRDLNNVAGREKFNSVHIAFFPKYTAANINTDLEERMELAQKISSMVLGLRRKVSIKVRQPLNKILVPSLNKELVNKIDLVKDIILSEVNIKDIEFIDDTSGIMVKKIKPNFKSLGPKYGKLMKSISKVVNAMSNDQIAAFEKEEKYSFEIEGQKVDLELSDVEIISEDIPGWLVANEGSLTIALDINISEELKQEGIAREFINRIQNFRKDSGFDVTDKIKLQILKHDALNLAIENFKDYIGSQTLAVSISLVDELDKSNGAKFVEIDENVSTYLTIEKS